ncbi:PIG-L family deacetylase [Aquibacillus salsiterrae]|uniref:PIG-L family deacetylase n=1 Tax=Aquibacillus salsiterrae TaxID=2950439 RepID=A0A9X3WD20_9BACI|nr:PIG-L family deacetylase [Aquibacillus salsiterrae]MDC3417617.1 PIG-L family deacetylase [Aquibacillus salsiterrae]
MATILAVFAHPDDETFICGGTLAKYAHLGHQVKLVCATKGEMGRRMGVPPIATRETIASIREKELEEACKALNIDDLRFLGIRDKLVEIQDLETLIKRVIEQMKDVKPDAVITFHETLGGHPDHCSIGLATKKAFYRYSKNLGKPIKLFYLSSGMVANKPKEFGLSAEQMVQVNVNNYLPHKLKAFRAHRTQTEMNDWLWKRDEISLRKFAKFEYFIQAQSPYQEGLDTLL